MKLPAIRHRSLWTDRVFISSVVIGIFLFFGSLGINYFAMTYAADVAGNATTDILLQNLPVVNTDIIFSEGALIFIFFALYIFLLDPKTIPFTVKSAALFIVTRAAFATMTHLGPDPLRIMTDLDSLRFINSTGADLFFSGHTGMPFLMALLFWEHTHLRWIFLTSSVIAAAAVILGHLHYTIDVFSAFFITYGIYHISRKIFKKDFRLFTHGPGYLQARE